MNFLKKYFGKKEDSIKTYADFWNWFLLHEQSFYNCVKSGDDIENNFFNKIAPKLGELKDGIFYLTGMYDDNIAELVLTPDGIIKNIVFVEELVKAAPNLPNWKFTELKPELEIEDVSIEMDNYTFGCDNLSFYPIEHTNYPDEVDIVLVHHDYKEADRTTIVNGTFIFLDNYLGELNSVTMIDNVTVISKEKAEKELIQIIKLKPYLIWREKEFVEKYSGLRYNTEMDTFSTLEAELEGGKPLLAIMNTTLLEWDSKASHPWILKVEIKYDGNARNGMPDSDTYEMMNKFEDEIFVDLKDYEGYLNLGRQTADNVREIYFACKDFRKPSKVLYELTKNYLGKLDINYEIYKDKYWQSFERFRPN